MPASNSFFDWAVSLTRFVKRDTARSDEINDALDSISNGFTAAEALTNAAIKLPAGETSAAIGNVAARKGKVLTFNATTGAAEASIATTDVATIAANIANVNTVSGISGNVTTVAGISASVTTVAGISGSTSTVAGISGNVTAVAGVSADVTTVAGVSTSVPTVAGVAASVSTVAGISANVTTVAGISANTTTVAGISAAVSTVATNATAVSTVSTNIADVNTAATNIADIIAAPTEASNAAASAVSASNYAAAIQSTSVTSLAIAIASKTFATQASKQFASGQFVTASSAANSANYMHGQVTSYSGTSLTVNVIDIGGSGTLADWNISISGTQGAPGTLSGNASGAISMVDQQFSRALVIDCGYVYLDKGNSGTALQTFDYTAGSVQKVTATDNHTFAFSNWPPTGNEGYMRVDFADYGAFVITPPVITWTNPDGTETTTLSAHFTALAAAGGRAGFTASGLTKAIFWCKDAGTTVYGRFI